MKFIREEQAEYNPKTNQTEGVFVWSEGEYSFRVFESELELAKRAMSLA